MRNNYCVKQLEEFMEWMKQFIGEEEERGEG